MSAFISDGKGLVNRGNRNILVKDLTAPKAKRILAIPHSSGEWGNEMKQRRGVPQSTPLTMAAKLRMDHVRPLAVAKQNLALAKTQYQVAYWREVALILLPNNIRG